MTARHLRVDDLPLSHRDLIDDEMLRRASERTRGFLSNTGGGLTFSGAFAAMGNWHLAAASLAVTAGTLALRLWADRNERGFFKLMDGPGGRQVTLGVLSEIGAGVLGIDRGHAWAVYDTPESQPRLMTETEFEAFRETAPHVVEIRAEGGRINVMRFTSGLPDSSATGLPAAEVFDSEGSQRACLWYIMGRKTTLGEVMKGIMEGFDEEAPASGPSP